MTVAAIKITDETNVRVLRVPSAFSPVKILKTREQGPAGPPGATLPPIAFAYGDATPRTIHTLTADALVRSVTVSIVDGFDGIGAQLKLGIAGNDELLMASSDSDPALECEFQTDPLKELPAGTNILLTIAPGAGASKGNGLLILEILEL